MDKHANFTRVNKIVVTNEASRVNVKVEPCFRLRVISLYRKKRCILRSLITNTWIQCTSSNYALLLSWKRGKPNLPRFFFTNALTCDTVGLKAEFFSRANRFSLRSFRFFNSHQTLQGFEVNCDVRKASFANSDSRFSMSVLNPVHISSASYLTFNSSSILTICRQKKISRVWCN